MLMLPKLSSRKTIRCVSTSSRSMFPSLSFGLNNKNCKLVCQSNFFPTLGHSLNRTSMLTVRVGRFKPPHRVPCRALNTAGRRSYHSSIDLEDEERTRLTTLRLYRILQRACTKFESQAPGNDSILLQPLLEAPDWGRHVTFTPTTPTQLDDIYRLFYVWNDSEEERGVGVFSRGIGGNADGENTATPSAKTTARQADSSKPSSVYTPSAIDDWYHELVGQMQEDATNNDEEHTALVKLSWDRMTCMTCWTSKKQLQEAIRNAFRSLQYKTGSSEDDYSTKITPKDMHKWAIKAFQILQEQQILWAHSSVETTDRVVRIVATSRCIGTAASTPTTMPPSAMTPQILADSTPKYRFAYRIRIENISDDQTIQLLGRYWHISEEPAEFVSLEGADISNAYIPPPIVVDSPKTGAVGQLPVLQPGQAFEYMSGTDLATPRGVMKGHLYMARVPATAQSAKSGDNVEALTQQTHKHGKGPPETGDEKKFETTFFEAKVAPFCLEAD